VTARLPLRGPWPIAPGDVVLIVTGVGTPPGGRADDCERYARVVSVRRQVRSRRVVALTAADGRRYAVHSGARLRWVREDGGDHVGCVGVLASEVVR
jgi:hypothetical protein